MLQLRVATPHRLWHIKGDFSMNLEFLLRGWVLGLLIAAPVGPIGVLCIRRTLAEGRLYGFVSGLGAATADATYGAVAAFVLTFISGLLIGQRVWMQIIGGLFLCYLGIRTFTSRPAEQSVEVQSKGLASAYGSTFFLTLTNPMTILSFGLTFAGLGVANTGGNYLAAALVVIGVFLGSATWWFTLSGGISLVRSRFSLTAMQWVNRVSGAVITTFGFIALISIFVNK